MMEGVTECQSFADFQSLRDTVEAVFGGPVSIVSSKSVEQANKDIRDGETKFPTCLQFKNVRLGCKQFGFRAEGKNTRATHSPVKIQCPAHVIAVANKDMGVLVIKQVCLEHNHPTVAFSTPERHRMPPALVEDDHPVSDVGLTITVSCKDQTSVVGNEGITAESNELKPGLLSDDDDGDDNEGEDSDDEEEEEEEEDDNNDSEDDDEEESDSPGSSSQQKKTLRKNSKKIRITVGRYHKYAMEDMERAYKAIKERSMSVHTASQKFGIPKSTLYDRINDRSVYNLGGKPNRWKTRILDEETEHQMVDHIKHMESIGQALSQAEILSLATKLAQTAGTIPKSRSLSRGWYKAFICRWPDTKKGPENVHKPGGMIGVYRKPKSKQEYFVTVKSIMDKCRLHCKPHFVYKLDEIVFNLEKKASAMPQPQKRAQIFGDTDSMSTVLLCGNALGYSIPPYFAFKKRKNLNLSQGSSMDGSVFKSGDSGLVSAAAIKDFLLNHFIPHTVKKEDEQVLLLYEDHASVITHSLAEWAAEQGIILYTLPAIYSDPSRSLDFGCFYPFCQAFTSVGAGFLEEHRKKITAHDLAQLVYMAMIRSVTMKNLKASFLQAGIYPFDKARKELLLAKNLSDSGSSGKRKRSSAKKSGRKRVRVS